MSTIPSGHRLVIDWLPGVNPSVCRGGLGDCTPRNVSRRSCRRGEGHRCLCINEIQLWGTYGQTKRSETFTTSLIASHITFSVHPGMDFHTSEKPVDLWHLPNIGQDLNGPLQPEVVGLDVHLCRFVEPVPEEGRGCSHEVLYCLEPEISIGVTHPK